MIPPAHVLTDPNYRRHIPNRPKFHYCLQAVACFLVLLHNHPSGDPTPSQADIDMTRKIAEAARPLGVVIHDHLVVGKQMTASFRALGLM